MAACCLTLPAHCRVDWLIEETRPWFYDNLKLQSDPTAEVARGVTANNTGLQAMASGGSSDDSEDSGKAPAPARPPVRRETCRYAVRCPLLVGPPDVARLHGA